MAGRVTCKVCPASYNKSTDLMKHLKVHLLQSKREKIRNEENHSDESQEEISIRKGFACNICEKTFINSNKLKRHVDSVHNKLSLNLYKCEPCGKVFGQRRLLKTRVKTIHEKMKEHRCVSCDKIFRCKGTLKRHVNTVHKNVKNHKCEYCDKNFCQKASLDTHMKTVHENVKKVLVISTFWNYM